MHSQSSLFRQAIPVVIGQCIIACALMGTFLLFGRLDSSVIRGCVAGSLIALGNYLLMTFFACLAADKASHQDVAGGQKLLQLSYLGRMAGLALVLAVLAKSGRFQILALALPLLFTRPILTTHAFFSRKEGN